MTEPVKEKKKMGRPPKAKKGALLWVQAEFVDSVTAFLDTLKQQAQHQQAQQ
jgi:hypothetical protein